MHKSIDNFFEMYHLSKETYLLFGSYCAREGKLNSNNENHFCEFDENLENRCGKKSSATNNTSDLCLEGEISLSPPSKKVRNDS